MLNSGAKRLNRESFFGGLPVLQNSTQSYLSDTSFMDLLTISIVTCSEETLLISCLQETMLKHSHYSDQRKCGLCTTLMGKVLDTTLTFAVYANGHIW
jgi:uncharacterized membrane protein